MFLKMKLKSKGNVSFCFLPKSSIADHAYCDMSAVKNWFCWPRRAMSIFTGNAMTIGSMELI